jgi:hypothetical protein
MAFHGTLPAITGSVSVAKTLYTTGHAYVSGSVQVGDNIIRASDGGNTITMDTSDNVTVGGNLKVGGNIIQASDGGSTITMDTSDNVTIGGTLEIDGNQVKDSGGNTQLTFDGSGVSTTVAGDLFVNDYARIDALRVGTTSTDPGGGVIYVEDYGVFVGGLRVGSSADPGANNLSVAGDALVSGELKTATISYTDGDDAIAISDDGYIQFKKGLINAGGVFVSDDANSVAGQWCKIASAVTTSKAAEGQFIVSIGGAIGAAYIQSTTFIVHAVVGDNSATNLILTAEPFHYDGNGYSVNDATWDPTTDLAVTWADNAAEIWVKSPLANHGCVVTAIGGPTVTEGRQSHWVLPTTSEGWVSSIDDLGTITYGRWADKIFANTKVWQLVASGSLTVTGSATINEAGAYGNDFVVKAGGHGHALFVDAGKQYIGMGVNDPDTRLEIFGTGSQLKLSYDASNSTTFEVASDGDITVTPGGGDFVVAGNIATTADILHVGDTDTKIAFTPDNIDFEAGGVKLLRLTEATNDLVKIGRIDAGTDVDTQIIGTSEVLIHVDAGNNRVAIGGSHNMNKLTINHSGSDGNDGIILVMHDNIASGTFMGGIGFDSLDPSGGNIPSTILEASAYIAAYGAESHTTSDKGGHLAFGTTLIDDNDDTVSHERMRIMDSGKIGIGTNNPMNKLEIGHGASDGDNGLMIVSNSTVVSAGDLLGGIGFDARDGNVPSSILESSVYLAGHASESHTTSDKGGYLVVGTAAINEDDDVTSNEVARFTEAGILRMNYTGDIVESASGHGLEIYTYSNTAGDSGQISFYKADSTFASPASTDSSDDIGNIQWFAYNGTDAAYDKMCDIFVEQSGVKGASDCGGANMHIRTTADGGTTLYNMINIYASGDVCFPATGQVGIGTNNPNAKLHIVNDADAEIGLLVDGDSAGSSVVPIARFISDDTGMSSNQAVVEIDSADTSMSSTNYFIEFTQNNSIVGSINSEVVYTTFTGGHSVKMIGDLPRRGSIIKSTGNVLHRYKGISNVLMKADVCADEKDKAAIGIYNGIYCTESEISGIIGEGCGDIHLYNALGEGQMLVSDLGGNIEVGDYICSSTRAGHGMLQDDDLLHNYTVAKALEAIDFSTVEVDPELGFKSVMLACTYHAA